MSSRFFFIIFFQLVDNMSMYT